MPTTVEELSRLIHRLQDERQQHANAIAVIDQTFASLGITAQPAKRRGRKPGSVVKAAAPAAAASPAKDSGGKKKRRRVKAKDGLTGEAFLYKVLADGAMSTSDINGKWIASGRNGRADILLGQLVAKGKLKRAKVKDGRGSNYTVA